ncbi:reverse transcriptase domain-containing protein [Tanacetum coccineum]
MTNLTDMLFKFVNANTASSSGTGSLPSNTVTNPKEDLKGITTRSGVAYQGPTIPTTYSSPKVVERETEVTKDTVPPTNNGSTKDVQPSVVQVQPQVHILRPVVCLSMDECLALADHAPSIRLRISCHYPEGKDFHFRTHSYSYDLLELADASISQPIVIRRRCHVKEIKFHFPADFVVIDFDADPRVPLILRRSFLKTGRALIDVYKVELTLRVGKEAITFNLDQTSRYSSNYDDITANQIDIIEMACEEYSQEVLGFSDLIANLSIEEKAALIKVLKSRKRAIAWKLSDIKGINPEFYTHMILMEDDYKQEVQHQRWVNPKNHDVIKKEVEKLLDAGLIYPMSDSPWVSPVHCVPKKGGFTVVANDENELIPTRLVTGWRMCIDYRKLNEATHKDHFPLPFMDQMLERLAGNDYYCFLDGFSGYFQISIDPKDQEKKTFTCPYGTFAYRRMPFGLYNAPGTFQRCMLAIFHDMVEKTMEVFMDDFSVFGNSFENCLSRLDKMLQSDDGNPSSVNIKQACSRSSLRYQDYQDKDCQGRLLSIFQDDEHVGTKTQDRKMAKTTKISRRKI